ncbi:U-box domain-containing protein, partial [Musa troglodytarum]
LLSLAITQHALVTLYNVLSIEAYCSIIGLKKPLIVALMDLLGAPDIITRSIKDVFKTFFDLALYLLNYTTLVELGVMSPLFVLVV